LSFVRFSVDNDPDAIFSSELLPDRIQLKILSGIGVLTRTHKHDCTLGQGCKNPERQFARTPQFCTEA